MELGDAYPIGGSISAALGKSSKKAPTSSYYILNVSFNNYWAHEYQCKFDMKDPQIRITGYRPATVFIISLRYSSKVLIWV